MMLRPRAWNMMEHNVMVNGIWHYCIVLLVEYIIILDLRLFPSSCSCCLSYNLKVLLFLIFYLLAFLFSTMLIANVRWRVVKDQWP